MSERAWVEFEDVEAISQTALALKVIVEEKTVWIPQSQISENSEVWKNGQKGTLIVTEWIAEEKGLI